MENWQDYQDQRSMKSSTVQLEANYNESLSESWSAINTILLVFNYLFHYLYYNLDDGMSCTLIHPVDDTCSG